MSSPRENPPLAPVLSETQNGTGQLTSINGQLPASEISKEALLGPVLDAMEKRATSLFITDDEAAAFIVDYRNQKGQEAAGAFLERMIKGEKLNKFEIELLKKHMFRAAPKVGSLGDSIRKRGTTAIVAAAGLLFSASAASVAHRMNQTSQNEMQAVAKLLTSPADKDKTMEQILREKRNSEIDALLDYVDRHGPKKNKTMAAEEKEEFYATMDKGIKEIVNSGQPMQLTGHNPLVPYLTLAVLVAEALVCGWSVRGYCKTKEEQNLIFETAAGYVTKIVQQRLDEQKKITPAGRGAGTPTV